MPPPTTLTSPIFHCCQTIETLALPDKPTAHSLLQRAATQVRPLMAKRRWSVPVLAEFYPPHPNLLGLNHNHGQKIEIRLRSPGSTLVFLPYESILGTLLHELTHIEVGPHNAQFYALLDQLKQECDQLRNRHDDGSSTFVGHGQRVGQGIVTNVPKHQARERAIRAAEKRRRTNLIMNRTSPGGHRLGGTTQDIACLCDPREMALAAAERRRLDEDWCGNRQVVEVIDLVQPDPQQQELSHEHVPVRRAPRRQRAPASGVPVRESPASLAAMQRAWANGHG